MSAKDNFGFDSADVEKGSQRKEHDMAEWGEGSPASACAVAGHHTGCGALVGKAKVCQLPEWVSAACPGDRGSVHP